MKRRLNHIPIHRISLMIPSELYDEMLAIVPVDESITHWIEDAIRERLLAIEKERQSASEPVWTVLP